MRNFSLIIYAMTFCVCTATAQWTTQNSGTSTFLTNVFFPAPDTGYVSKEDGSILKTINGGNNWTLVSPPGTAFGFYFTSVDTGYAISDETPQTNNGTSIKKTTNGGTSWTIMFFDTTVYFASLFFPNENIGYALASNISNETYIYKTTNAGGNWFLISTLAMPLMSSTLFFTDTNTGYYSNGGIFKTTDGGLNWASSTIDSTGNSEIYSINFPSGNIGYGVGVSYITGNVVYKTTDAGLTWVQQTTQESNPLYSVYFTSNDTGYAVGGNGFSSGTVIKTFDGGNNWTLALPQTATFNSIYFPNKNTGYAVGSNGTIIKYSETITSTILFENSMQRNSSSFVYPNPTTNGKLTIAGKGKEISSLEIYNVIGKTIYESTFSPVNKFDIDISSQPKGVYFIKPFSGENSSFHRIVIE